MVDKSYHQEIQDTAFQENTFYLHGESDVKLYTTEISKYWDGRLSMEISAIQGLCYISLVSTSTFKRKS